MQYPGQLLKGRYQQSKKPVMGTSRDSGLFYAFTDNDEPYLVLGQGLKQAARRLRNPSAEFPAFVVLVERHGQAQPSSRHLRPLADISLGSLSDLEQAVFMVKVDIEHIYSKLLSGSKRLYLNSHRVVWTQRSAQFDPHGLMDEIFSRLILPFTDVLFLFVDDFASPREALDILVRWSHIAAKLRRPWKPRLVVISRKRLATLDHNELSSFEVMRPLRLSRERSKILNKSILQHVIAVHGYRSANKTLFSADHLVAFFEAALKNIAQSLHGFNFIAETRAFNPVEPNFGANLQTFLEISSQNEMSKEFVFRYIASALVMDSCPPGMHRFPADDVFDTLYHSACFEAFAKVNVSPFDSCKLLKAKFRRLYDFTEPGHAAQSRRDTIRSFSIDWGVFRTTRICLTCIQRKPEHAFRCGHSLCDICVRIFGAKIRNREYAYLLTTCPICIAGSSLVVDLKPPTAGARLLVLDGGGIRGIFSILAIQALDSVRRLPYPIYDDFDLALGTSSGGLITLMMFLRRTMLECLSIFETLATKVFSDGHQSNWLLWLYGILLSLVTDSRYGSEKIESCIREAYGSETLLFSGLGHPSGKSSTKFAVTTVSVSTSQLCILSTYNGRLERRGYTLHRPKRADEEVLVREAARATSAAPSYFPAKRIRGLGYLQDGGAGKYNNPIDPAEWEAKAIWDVASDFVISVGTGYSQTPQQSPVIARRLRFRDRFFPRLFRIFDAMINAQSSWNEHINRQSEEEREKYFRINMPLDQAPELDDSREIPRMKRRSVLFLERFDFRPAVQALFSASFFLELHSMPIASRKKLNCYGAIRCRSPDSRALVDRILDEYPTACFSVDAREGIGELGNQSICKNCGQYNKEVTFSIDHIDQSLSIYLLFNPLCKRKISGFPQSASSLTKKQLIGAAFGRSDHGLTYTRACYCLRKRKRSLSRRVSSVKRIKVC